MILIILILAVIAFIYFNVIPKKGYMPLAIISLLIAVLSITGIVAHDYNHYGMKTQTTTVKKELVSSSSPQLPVLLYQPLGNGTEKIYLYKTKNTDKKPTPIKTDKTHASVKTAAKPSMTIKTERYVFSNGWNQFLFGWFGHNNELKHREYTFNVPKNWKVLSIKQAKSLQKQMAKRAAMMKKMQQMKQAQMKK